jgi:hypothetical protein
MGRPIQKKYFANTNVGITGEGVGGEQVSAVYVATTGSGWSTSTAITWTASAPQVPGGQAAYGTVTVDAGGGWATAFTVTDGGSGYTSTSSVTLSFSTDPTTTGTYVVNINPSTTLQNGIAAFAYIPASGTAGYISGTGGSSREAADIIRQSGNSKYVVRTAQGVGVCRLQDDGSAANAVGEMDITATDWNESTYRVMKLHARKAKLKQVTSSTAFLVADETWTKWTFSAATGTVVTIANN